jgi:hypothetical protein
MNEQNSGTSSIVLGPIERKIIEETAPTRESARKKIHVAPPNETSLLVV